MLNNLYNYQTQGVYIISGNDYVKFMTEQVVTYIDMPSNERKERRSQQKSTQSMYANRWLGVLPFMLRTFLKRTD